MAWPECHVVGPETQVHWKTMLGDAALCSPDVMEARLRGGGSTSITPNENPEP